MKAQFVKLFIAATLTSAAGSALADYQHVPLKRVEGFVVHSSVSVSNLTINEGQYAECSVTVSGLPVTRCRLEQASMTLEKGTGDTMTVPLSQLSYYKSSNGDQIYQHYIYKGIWSVTQNGKTLESDIVINIIQTGAGTPDVVRGYLTMNDLDVSEQIKAQAFPN